MDEIWDLIADLADDPVFWVLAPISLCLIVGSIEVVAFLTTGSWLS